MEVAHDLIIERGYTAMSMDEVAERAGVAKATLYQHFPSKEELAIRVIVRAMQHVETLIAQQDSSLSAIERLEQACRSIMAHRIAKQRADLSGQDSAPLPVRSHPLFQAQRHRLEMALVGLVEQAQAEGDIGTHLPPVLFIHVMLAVARGLDYDALLTSGSLTPTDLQTMVVDLLFNGPRSRRE